MHTHTYTQMCVRVRVCVCARDFGCVCVCVCITTATHWWLRRHSPGPSTGAMYAYMDVYECMHIRMKMKCEHRDINAM